MPTLRRDYLLWLLPALLWLDFGALRRTSKDLVGAAVATTVLALWVLGPATIGPLRWPLRVAPALMVPLVLLLFVAASRALVRAPSRGRLLSSLAWVGLAAYFVAVRDTTVAGQALSGVALVAAALGTTAWSLRRGSVRMTSAVVVAWTIAMVVVQFVVDPVPGAADRNMPAAPAAYASQLGSARGDVMMLGSPSGPLIHEPALADELLTGSLWYLNPKAVQNGYTTISFRTFQARFCRSYSGGTCEESLKALLATDKATGRPWVDLLSVSTIAIYRPWFPGTNLTRPPRGWSVSQSTANTIVWRRDTPVASAGGVVATTPGLGVQEQHRSDREVAVRVTAVGASGGTVTLSRLAWPGYAARGGALAAPLDGMLVRVTVPAGSVGSVVTVRWDPPGWNLERAALWLAVLMGILWVALAAVAARRARPRLG